MIRIRDAQEAEKKTFADINDFLKTIRTLSGEVKDVDEGIKRLRSIRQLSYENLNQIQHEHLVLMGIRWLRNIGFDNPNYEWYWNPRQTGDAKEPDLMVKSSSGVVLCGEVTTSENPVGVIDSRMRDTLDKLNKMSGQKFYFVRTISMEKRAKTKVGNGGHSIKVVFIDLDA